MGMEGVHTSIHMETGNLETFLVESVHTIPSESICGQVREGGKLAEDLTVVF